MFSYVFSFREDIRVSFAFLDRPRESTTVVDDILSLPMLSNIVGFHSDDLTDVVLVIVFSRIYV